MIKIFIVLCCWFSTATVRHNYAKSYRNNSKKTISNIKSKILEANWMLPVIKTVRILNSIYIISCYEPRVTNERPIELCLFKIGNTWKNIISYSMYSITIDAKCGKKTFVLNLNCTYIL